MKIDTSTIQGYSEMTAEQKLAALESFEYDDYSAELEKAKTSLSKANSEAAEWKRKHNALLDEDGRKKLAEDEAKAADAAKYAELESKYNDVVKRMTISEYKANYLAQGYDDKLAADTAEALADGKMEKVFANAEAFKKALEAKIKSELMDSTPKPNGGSGDKPNPYVEQAKNIGKTKAEADKKAADILSQYIKT